MVYPDDEKLDVVSSLAKPSKKYCPVGKEYLGRQEPGMEITLHCNDCRAWYTWFPGVSKPISKLDKDIPKTCSCPGCKQRRGEEE